METRTKNVERTFLTLTPDELEEKWAQELEAIGIAPAPNLSVERPVTIEPAQMKKLDTLFLAAVAHARGDVDIDRSY